MSVGLDVALLGCGVITQRTLPGLTALLNERGGRISALCDPVESNLRLVARACADRGVGEFLDLETLLRESDCGIVFVATPIGLHFDHVYQALQADRHVYCHKTLAHSADACAMLRALAADKGLKLAASPGQMLLGAYARARSVVDSGELGDIVSIDVGTEAVPHRFEPERAREKTEAGRPFSWEWYHKRSFGGGPLNDMFVYPLAFLTDLFGYVTRVAARGRLATPRIDWQGRVVEADAADSYGGILEFGEIAATFRASFSSSGRLVPWGAICIHGTKGCLEIEKRNDLSYRLHLSPNGCMPTVECYEVFGGGEVERFGSVECHVLTDMAELLSACSDDRQVRGATAENAIRVAHGLALIERSAELGGTWVDAEA